MANITPDLSNLDEMSMCIRYSDSNTNIRDLLIEITEKVDKTGKSLYTSF